MQNVPAIIVCGRKAGIHFQAEVVIGQRTIQISLRFPSQPTIAVGFSQPRIECDGLAVSCDRFSISALSVEYVAAIVMSGGVTPINPDGGIKISHRSIEMSFGVTSNAAIVIGQRPSRIKSNSSVVI